MKPIIDIIGLALFALAFVLQYFRRVKAPAPA